MTANAADGSSRRYRRNRWLAASLVASTAIAVAASSATAQQAGSASSSCQSQVSTLVAQHVAAKGQDWFPSSSPKGSLVKGKRYWIIALTTAIPTIADYANGFKNAGKALGADVTVF